MILLSKCEFRGSTSKISNKTGNVYRYVNLEDVNGESVKLQCADDVNVTELKKGTSYLFNIDYDSKYNSLKVLSFEDLKKV